ncbi:hypothetical protein [Bradyrhizobium sp. LVM 105]|uniref:hypothetical protein n=1 Tax=Bradyrhizobium sp. LVM 105 TaxID=2341115 RepID=UPI0013E09356|nr:hypothetical protein [Bradyrhizobium sp. LVM 105]
MPVDLANTLGAAFPIAHQGFSVESRGRKSPRACTRASGLCREVDRAFAGTGWPGNSSQKHDAETAEFTGLRELGRNPLSMLNRGILIGIFASGLIGRETVFIDDVKIVAHVSRLGRAAIIS